MDKAQQTVERVSAEELARRSAAAMWAGDHASQGLDLRLEQVAPRYARVSMQVRQSMVNGHAICHGGFIFLLADTAFAYACNSGNQVTVASGASIDFIAPARLGDVLTAVAEERGKSGRAGVYDVRVESQNGSLVALFRGKSHALAGQLVAGVELEA
jgi:acyl-CoA thioesterase